MLWPPKARVVVFMSRRIPARVGHGMRPLRWQAATRSGRTQGPWHALARNGYPVRVSGYAAMAQIREAHPRRAGTMSPFGSPFASVSEPIDRPVAEELVGRSFDDRLVDWWDTLTANLSQTTFFLLDPESWR